MKKEKQFILIIDFSIIYWIPFDDSDSRIFPAMHVLVGHDH